MKTKLLKKVRKRFAINRIDKIGKADKYYNSHIIKKYYSVPFFEVRDIEGVYFEYFHTKNEALSYLQKIVLKEYSEHGKKSIKTKIWH